MDNRTEDRTGTNGDKGRRMPRAIDVLMAVPLMRDEADLGAAVARHYGVNPIDLFHLAALNGLQYQLKRNGAEEHAALVEGTIRHLAAACGLTPIERRDGDPEPATFEREGHHD